MKNERGEDGPLDRILSMGRLSSEGNIYSVELEIRGGPQVGKVQEIKQAHIFPAGSNRFMIIERKPSGDVNRVPILALYSGHSNTEAAAFNPESVAKVLRKARKDRGTRRTGLGHVG